MPGRRCGFLRAGQQGGRERDANLQNLPQRRPGTQGPTSESLARWRWAAVLISVALLSTGGGHADARAPVTGPVRASGRQGQEFRAFQANGRGAPKARRRWCPDAPARPQCRRARQWCPQRDQCQQPQDQTPLCASQGRAHPRRGTVMTTSSAPAQSPCAQLRPRRDDARRTAVQRRGAQSRAGGRV